MATFDEKAQEHQVAWRRDHVFSREWGGQGGARHPWILPSEDWQEGLWPGIRSDSANSLPAYLAGTGVQRHGGSNNLKSSWVLCANLYFPFRMSEGGRSLLAAFLKARVDQRVQSVDRVELEYAEEGDLAPAKLLGETGGARGAGQTSPDVAFITNGGRGLILTESKHAEHSFYSCSARQRTDKQGRPGNRAPERCDHATAVLDDPQRQCHQVAWGRKYWDHLSPVLDRDALSRLKCCPAARGGYQLFRQQALAEGIATSSRYDFVVSCVAMDGRNDLLASCLEATGIARLEEWADLFRGRARFTVFAHQHWVVWVREHDSDGHWRDWLNYVERRYGYAP